MATCSHSKYVIGAKEMSQGIKRLLHNHEDLSLDLWMNPHKSQVEAHLQP